MKAINTIVTSREAILTVCRDFVSKNGLQSLTIRAIAKECNISVGSVYNYFPSKADLAAATIEHVWQTIFYEDKKGAAPDSFPQYVKWIYDNAQKGIKRYPNFFTAHSLTFTGNERTGARHIMDDYFNHMKSEMTNVLGQDQQVSASAFSDTFTTSDFTEFIFSNLLMLMMNQAASCDTLVEIISRTIY